MKQYIVGVDVGGTNIKFGLVDYSGKIIARACLDTKQFHRHRAKLIIAIIQEISDLILFQKLTPKNVSGIGIGLPGLIDSKRGVVTFLPNVTGWRINISIIFLLGP